MFIPTIEMYCSECEESMEFELYDEGEHMEMWQCVCCNDMVIINK
jgi:hypothetical protein